MEREVIIATHDAGFHPDDCFAVAALLLLLDEKPVIAKIVRSRDEKTIASADFVVDVGGISNPETNRFDHHQIAGAGKRPGGVSYASFGLVWKKFGARISGGEEIAAEVDRILAAPIDARDNGEDTFAPVSGAPVPYLLDDLFHALMPTWQEEKVSVDAVFLKAVALARQVIEREIADARAKAAGAAAILKIYRGTEDKRILVFDREYSWKRLVAGFPEPLFVVLPRRFDGLWTVHAVPKSPPLFENRKDLPESWAGKRGRELAAETGVFDAVFCHRNRFMAVAKTRDGAVALARIGLLDA